MSLHIARRLVPASVRRGIRLAQLHATARRDPTRAEARSHALRGPLARGVRTVRRLGFDLDLDLADGASRVLYYTGQVERSLLGHVVPRLRRDDVVVDVGAHIGITALAFGRRLLELGGGRVFAFEAAPDTAGLLRDHVARNGLTDVVEVVETALLDAPGSVTLQSDAFFGAGDRSVRSLFGDGPVTATVPATTLDAWAAARGLERLDAVKLDVEGAEAAVLRGGSTTLRQLRPRLVVAEEKSYLFERAGLPPDAVSVAMAESGYVRRGTIADVARQEHDAPRAEARTVLDHDEDNVVYMPAHRTGEGGTAGAGPRATG